MESSHTFTAVFACDFFLHLRFSIWDHFSSTYSIFFWNPFSQGLLVEKNISLFAWKHVYNMVYFLGIEFKVGSYCLSVHLIRMYIISHYLLTLLLFLWSQLSNRCFLVIICPLLLLLFYFIFWSSAVLLWCYYRFISFYLPIQNSSGFLHLWLISFSSSKKLLVSSSNFARLPPHYFSPLLLEL